jgi:hypothetical protein
VQVQVGELLALTFGDGATECSAVFLVGVAAYGASAPCRWHMVGAPSAHAAARVLAVTGDIRSPFGWTAGVDAPLPVDISRRALGTQLSRRTEPQRNVRRGKADPRTVDLHASR